MMKWVVLVLQNEEQQVLFLGYCSFSQLVVHLGADLPPVCVLIDLNLKPCFISLSCPKHV